MTPISYLRDDFQDNLQAATWGASFVLGSATKAETVGQARFTLPSSTAGTHIAAYQTGGTYDLTGDGFYINIDTMVATGVAATAFFQLFIDASNLVQWTQTSNTLKAQKIVAGVTTDLYSATWSGTTYKYLRIRESGGNLLFDSSTNGTSWTNRHTTTGLPIAITALGVALGASCGNVASPGSFRIEDVNLILPALSSTWHWTQVEWPLLNRFRTITIAASSGQGYVATSNDGTTWAYYSGPIGSASGGYAALTFQSTQAAAQAMAVNLPSSSYARWDLPSLVECRFIRLYHRSITGGNYRIDEYYPRRLLQSDDIEAESIQAINLAAASVTADKIFVLTLGAITANIGKLNIDTTGYLYQGTGTGDSPTTGLKIFNSGGIGKLSTYNATVEQVTFDTDGILKAGSGDVQLSASGIYIVAGTSNLYNAQRSYGFIDTVGGNRVADIYDLEGASAHSLNITLFSKASRDGQMILRSEAPSAKVAFVRLQSAVNSVVGAQLDLNSGGGSPGVSVITGDFSVIAGGVNLGSATGAATGEVRASQSLSGPRSGGSAVYAVDTTALGSSITLANNAIATPFSNASVFGGMILLNETQSFGSVGLFVTGGGLIAEVADPGNKYSAVFGTANMINVYVAAGQIVAIENKTGSTITLNVTGFRNRTTN